MTDLHGKVILITGSSRGIGAATAIKAKEYGAEVILHGRTESEELKEQAQTLGAAFIACDVGDKVAVQEAITSLPLGPKINSLVNSAGIATAKAFEEADDALWLDLFQTNVLGIVHMCQILLPQMRKNGGSIVNVSSIRGNRRMAGAHSMAYAVSKASVDNLTGSLAKAYAPEVRVNAVAPGMTKTDISKTWPQSVWDQAASSLAGRAAEPEEIAEAMLFLASDKASYITGQVLTVDGGYEIAGK